MEEITNPKLNLSGDILWIDSLKFTKTKTQTTWIDQNTVEEVWACSEKENCPAVAKTITHLTFCPNRVFNGDTCECGCKLEEAGMKCTPQIKLISQSHEEKHIHWIEGSFTEMINVDIKAEIVEDPGLNIFEVDGQVEQQYLANFNKEQKVDEVNIKEEVVEEIKEEVVDEMIEVKQEMVEEDHPAINDEDLEEDNPFKETYQNKSFFPATTLSEENMFLGDLIQESPYARQHVGLLAQITMVPEEAALYCPICLKTLKVDHPPNGYMHNMQVQEDNLTLRYLYHHFKQHHQYAPYFELLENRQSFWCTLCLIEVGPELYSQHFTFHLDSKKMHLEEKTDTKEYKEYKCDVCNTIWSSQYRLYKHKKESGHKLKRGRPKQNTTKCMEDQGDLDIKIEEGTDIKKEVTMELDVKVCKGCKHSFKKLLLHLNSKSGNSCRQLYTSQELQQENRQKKYPQKNKEIIKEKQKRKYQANKELIKERQITIGTLTTNGINM